MQIVPEVRGVVLAVPPHNYVYHGMGMTVDPMNLYCTQGTYSAIIYQGF